MAGDEYGMVDCPTCAGVGVVHEDDADRAVRGQEIMEAMGRLDAGPKPPGLTRRMAPPDGYEAIYPCSIDPAEALVVEAVPGGREVAVSMLLGHHGADETGCIGWETECASLDRETVAELVAQLQAWLDSDVRPTASQEGE